MKQYYDVLVLARGLVLETKAQLGNGFQASDLVPIVSENFQKAMCAMEDAALIGKEWEEEERACIEATVNFAADIACDLLNIEDAPAIEFKETHEILAAVQSIVKSVVAHLPGGFQASEVFPVLSDNFSAITVASDGSSKVVSEFKAAPRAFIKAVTLFAVDLVFTMKASVVPAIAPQPFMPVRA